MSRARQLTRAMRLVDDIADEIGFDMGSSLNQSRVSELNRSLKFVIGQAENESDGSVDPQTGEYLKRLAHSISVLTDVLFLLSRSAR